MNPKDKKKPNTDAKNSEIEQSANDQQTEMSPTGMSPNEEQMMRRQSAPQPTAEQEAIRLYQQQMANAQQAGGAINGFQALAQPIGREQIQAANQTLMRYKEGKANLERKIVENEQWYKLRH